jgi:hypothetical protein
VPEEAEMEWISIDSTMLYAQPHMFFFSFASTGNEALMDDNLKAKHVFPNHVIFSCASRKLERS